jgi:hypothetical protein
MRLNPKVVNETMSAFGGLRSSRYFSRELGATLMTHLCHQARRLSATHYTRSYSQVHKRIGISKCVTAEFCELGIPG